MRKAVVVAADHDIAAVMGVSGMAVEVLGSADAAARESVMIEMNTVEQVSVSTVAGSFAAVERPGKMPLE